MRILMLGWEFPPFISGGLGTACYGLACAMEHLELDVVMLLPTNTQQLDATASDSCESIISPDNLTHVIFKTVPYKLPNPYSRTHPVRVCGTGQPGGYDGNLIDRVLEYAKRCVELVKTQTFDVIHAHDWVTFPAAVALATAMKKPLVVHVHATEFDRSGEYINQAVYDIERQGMETATAIITVSNYTADILVKRYAVPSAKIQVIHNGINPRTIAAKTPRPDGRSEPRVLFMGRITFQKGPEYFIKAAEMVMRKHNNVKFIMAGWGDMAPDIIEMVAARGLGKRIFFTGFLRGGQVDDAYRMSDVYVMPSISEPFGLTALEAAQNGLPVIISKTTGVGEVLKQGALKVDFWDVDKMAQQIIDVLNDRGLCEQLHTNAMNEIRDLTWDVAARKCLSVYNAVSPQVQQIGQNN